LKFLRKSQRADGSWVPLWFGNQDRAEEDNPIYGTAKVLVDVHPDLGPDAICNGIRFLVNNRNPDGGWGGGDSVTQFWESHDLQEFSLKASRSSTFEETSLAVEALASLWKRLCDHEFRRESSKTPDSISSLTELTRDAILSGTDWLISGVQAGHHRVAWPIGFYFAKLWYHERLYPLIFTTAALSRVASLAPTTDFPTSADFPGSGTHHDDTT
jgi:squalene-hopene/tetraprenyl-beta-curcumene cyclase